MVIEWLREENPEALLADGFEDALVGLGVRCSQPTLAVYSYAKAVDILMRRDGMTHAEAIEWMEYNVVGAWVGENTPLWLRDDQEGSMVGKLIVGERELSIDFVPRVGERVTFVVGGGRISETVQAKVTEVEYLLVYAGGEGGGVYAGVPTIYAEELNDFPSQ